MEQREFDARYGSYRQAVEAGRAAWLAGPGAVRACGEGAQASSPLTGFLR